MRKIIAIALLFIAVSAIAQNGPDTTAGPVITAVGKPDGAKTEIKINKDGSSLQSSDGMVALIIPEGAVPKNTVISIQPISNLMANGNGKAYRLEPSGIKFKKPLQLIFHYDDEEIKDSMQLLAGIAMQDDRGQWLSFKNCTIDTLAKTISANIMHFSDWANFMKIKLYPPYSRLKVKKQITLTIDLISSEDDGLSDLTPAGDDELSPLKKTSKQTFTTTWKANGIIKGNSRAGTIDAGTEKIATYKAPAEVPDQNPVAIAADIKGLNYATKVNGSIVTFKDLRLVSNILVYDNAYEVTITSSMDGNAGSELGTVTYKDTGSFVVSVNGKDTKIIEKVNRNIPDKLDYKGKCTVTQLKKGSGNVHLIGAQNIKVTPPASPGNDNWVEILFKRAPTIFPLLQFKCPPVGRGDWKTSTNAQANAMIAPMLPAFPQQIKFEAKEGERVIQEISQGGISYKVTVKKITEDPSID